VKTALTEKKRHNLVNQLGFQIDDEGLVRCTGRLGAAQITEGARQPILLPKRDHMTDLLIDGLHGRYFHIGVSQTLNRLDSSRPIRSKGNLEEIHHLQEA
jgi:hypothetical protein